MPTPTTNNLGRSAAVGAGVGVIASIVMAMYAMFASLAKDHGFFTPLYHIASLWISPSHLMMSMQNGMMHHNFTFAFGPAVLGAILHMMTGAMYGAVFGVIASRLNLGLGALAGLGLVYGFIVFVISSYIGLPIAGAIFSSGDQIKNMAKMAGWGTFIVEHLLFGITLGSMIAMAKARMAPASTPAH